MHDSKLYTTQLSVTLIFLPCLLWLQNQLNKYMQSVVL